MKDLETSELIEELTNRGFIIKHLEGKKLTKKQKFDQAVIKCSQERLEQMKKKYIKQYEAN